MRYLHDHCGPMASVDLARGVLAVAIADEATATRVLATAFGHDDRLTYGPGGWSAVAAEPRRRVAAEPELVLLVLDGRKRARREPFELAFVAAIRVAGGVATEACAGDPADARAAELRTALRETLDGAVPVVHDPVGGLAALERWLGEPLPAAISLRRLARDRLGLAAGHAASEAAARLGLAWRDSPAPEDRAELMAALLDALRRPGESVADLLAASGAGAPPIPWSSYGFDRTFLRELPREPGVYTFYDENDAVLYVGRSRNLRRRVGAYFREGAPRSARVQRIVEGVRRIEVACSGSDLEAVLREASAIARSRPRANVQREVHAGSRGARRLGSFVILEPAAPPWALRAYMIRDGRLVARVPIGPRGGGLARIERTLETRFFFPDDSPSAETPVAIDVELVARWLAANRDRVVAFDPTDLRSAREVVERLRWFLNSGTLLDPEGAPIRPR